MICTHCSVAVTENSPSIHRECPGPLHCDCQHGGSFPCRCGDYTATSIADMDSHILAMMSVEDDKQHGERR